LKDNDRKWLKYLPLRNSSLTGSMSISLGKVQEVFNHSRAEELPALTSENQKLKEGFLEKRKKPYAYHLHPYRL